MSALLLLPFTIVAFRARITNVSAAAACGHYRFTVHTSRGDVPLDQALIWLADALKVPVVEDITGNTVLRLSGLDPEYAFDPGLLARAADPSDRTGAAGLLASILARCGLPPGATIQVERQVRLAEPDGVTASVALAEPAVFHAGSVERVDIVQRFAPRPLPVVDA